jgi:hypothetical protein
MTSASLLERAERLSRAFLVGAAFLAAFAFIAGVRLAGFAGLGPSASLGSMPPSSSWLACQGRATPAVRLVYRVTAWSRELLFQISTRRSAGLRAGLWFNSGCRFLLDISAGNA